MQLHDWGWDFHGTTPAEAITDGLRHQVPGMDRAVAALIRDLKARGMLDETLIIWGGEFGRSPFREGRTAASAQPGTRSSSFCFTIFLAGGGIKPGITYGSTDELGFDVGEKPVAAYDLQATILHLLGLDHMRLTYAIKGGISG